MTDQEINEAVARNLGWKSRTKRAKEAGKFISDFCAGDGHELGCEEPLDYNNDISAAWDIVDHLKPRRVDLCRREDGKWICKVWHPKIAMQGIATEIADTAPMAVCKAFLKLEEVNGTN